MKPQAQSKLKPVQTESDSQSIKQKLHERQSKELVIAFCGPIGVDISTAKRAIEKADGDLAQAIMNLKE